MPCRDDSMYDVVDVKNQIENKEKEVRRELEPLLCEAFDLLEINGLIMKTSSELRKWAYAHEAKETARIKREAIEKLSPKERRALGLE